MTMDAFLDEYFGTTKEASAAAAPSDEDLQKQSQSAMFVKMAASHGIDVSKLSDPEVEWLWNKTFSKEAQAGSNGTKVAEIPPQFKKHDDKEHEEEKHKEEEAKKEHEEKKAAAQAQQKILEEGTFLGKVAAHAYVSELKKIAAAGGLKLAEFPPGFMHGKAEGKEEGKKEEKKEEKEEHEKKKEGSFDYYSAERALKMLGEAGYDTKVAADRLNAQLTLGLKPSDKVASIDSFDVAVHRRALEFCEAIGVPVTWEK